jgi:16S rRNA (cytosine967-C5)-methyltransferase
MSKNFVEYHLFQLLHRFECQHLPLDLFLSQYFKAHKALGAQDRRQIAHAAFGMIRWRALIDHVLDQHPSWEKRYQLFKNFKPISMLHVQSIPRHVRVSFPKELFDLLVKNYGEETAVKWALFSNEEAPICVRANPDKTSREALIEKWQEEWEVKKGSYAPHSIIFSKRAPLVSFPEFKEGMFEIQDEGSQLVAEEISFQPGQHVLDYCAGAGGKTLAYAYKSEGKGQLYLHDVRIPALQQAKKRLKRAGVQNAQLLSPMNSTLERLKGLMDWVLVDAPCSGTGTYRRNPDQKWKFSMELLKRVMEDQRMIFKEAVHYVKPGGRIVYATCSLLEEENEKQLEHFLKDDSLALEKPPLHTLKDFKALEMDGFFTAVMKKK